MSAQLQEAAPILPEPSPLDAEAYILNLESAEVRHIKYVLDEAKEKDVTPPIASLPHFSSQERTTLLAEVKRCQSVLLSDDFAPFLRNRAATNQEEFIFYCALLPHFWALASYIAGLKRSESDMKKELRKLYKLREACLHLLGHVDQEHDYTDQDEFVDAWDTITGTIEAQLELLRNLTRKPSSTLAPQGIWQALYEATTHQWRGDEVQKSFYRKMASNIAAEYLGTEHKFDTDTLVDFLLESPQPE